MFSLLNIIWYFAYLSCIEEQTLMSQIKDGIALGKDYGGENGDKNVNISKMCKSKWSKS